MILKRSHFAGLERSDLTWSALDHKLSTPPTLTCRDLRVEFKFEVHYLPPVRMISALFFLTLGMAAGLGGPGGPFPQGEFDYEDPFRHTLSPHDRPTPGQPEPSDEWTSRYFLHGKWHVLDGFGNHCVWTPDSEPQLLETYFFP